MTTEEFTLLRKAAADPKGQIALKRDPDGAWPSNRTYFQALSDRGHVLALGESMGPHIGGRLLSGGLPLKAAPPLANRSRH